MTSTDLFTEEWLDGPSNTKFYTRTYKPKDVPIKAAVVFVHGFAEHIQRYKKAHPLYVQKGIAIFTFDQRGFGLTALDKTGKKTKSSAYGVTSWEMQMNDIKWAIDHARKTFGENVPLFLHGHSMGGGEVLGFATEDNNSHLKNLSGIIAASPLLAQTTPANKALRWAGSRASLILPNFSFPAEVKSEDLSHDTAINDAQSKDPLCLPQGTLRGLNHMLTKGEELQNTRYKKWPKDLPLLIVHGDGDRVTSHKASQQFHDKLSADKKKIVIYPGGYHELHNEPDGVREKVVDEVVNFIEVHIPQSTENSASKL